MITRSPLPSDAIAKDQKTPNSTAMTASLSVVGGVFAIIAAVLAVIIVRQRRYSFVSMNTFYNSDYLNHKIGPLLLTEEASMLEDKTHQDHLTFMTAFQMRVS